MTVAFSPPVRTFDRGSRALPTGDLVTDELSGRGLSTPDQIDRAAGPVTPRKLTAGSEEPSLAIEFCGEHYGVPDGRPFVIGRGGDLVIDENPDLPLHLLSLVRSGGLWVLSNHDQRISVDISDSRSRYHAVLNPASSIPIVFRLCTVVFAAGPTTYEFDLRLSTPLYHEPSPVLTRVLPLRPSRLELTDSQFLLVLTLAESALRFGGSGLGDMPTTATAAERLGWTQTKFNRKLDSVCEKFRRAGVSGMRGDSLSYATNRRARVVEYALSHRMITRTDLVRLESLDSKPLASTPPASPPPAPNLPVPHPSAPERRHHDG